MYWRVFRETWLNSVGQATFKVSQDSLIQNRTREPNTYYLCVWLRPLQHRFPVVQPHLTLGTVTFRSLQDAWKANLHCKSYMWPREVTGEFTRYGEHNFALREGNELSALVEILREILQKDAVKTEQMDRRPHVSWTDITRFSGQ